MLKLANATRRMAIIELTGGTQIMLTRSRKDGSTVGFKGYVGSWKTLDVQELLDGLSWVTMTDDQLLAQGMPEDKVKVERPKRKAKPAIPDWEKELLEDL